MGIEQIENTVLVGDIFDKIKEIPDKSINTCVTSPPYWGLRDYGADGQIGMEETPELFVDKMVQVFREVKRVLRDDGTLWLNLGDSYAASAANRTQEQITGKSCKLTGLKKAALSIGNQQNKIVGTLKPKDMVGIPWMVAFALRDDGWYLRQDIIWAKPNPMPESVKDRCTKSHEYIFLLSKSNKYYYDYEAIKEPAAYLQANSPESIKSPYGQGFTRTPKNNGVGFGHGYDKNVKARVQYKGNRKTFRGGGKYTNNQSHNNTDKVDNDSIGNEKNGDMTRNKRSVWKVATKPFPGSHFATFPPELIDPCIKAGAPMGGVVLDPFFGAGTTGLVAHGLSRKYIGIELNPDYAEMAENRIKYRVVKEDDLKIAKQQITMDF